jgi:hypothetical protein
VPFCPTCRLEYRHGFSRCPDCDCDLVAALEDIPDPSIEDPAENYAQDWVPIAQFATQSYAELIKGGLKSLDIPVTLLSGAGHFGQTGQMGTSAQPAGGAFLILVPAEHVENALAEGEAMLGEQWLACCLVSED